MSRLSTARSPFIRSVHSYCCDYVKTCGAVTIQQWEGFSLCHSVVVFLLCEGTLGMTAPTTDNLSATVGTPLSVAVPWRCAIYIRNVCPERASIRYVRSVHPSDVYGALPNPPNVATNAAAVSAASARRNQNPAAEADRTKRNETKVGRCLPPPLPPAATARLS